MREPDFNNLLKVLKRERPDRPTLFEFFLCDPLYELLEDGQAIVKGDGLDSQRRIICAFKNAGYDYVTMEGSAFHFNCSDKEQKQTLSLNNGVIYDRESFDRYIWNEPDHYDYSQLETLALPEGMKFIIHAPNGVLENVISLVGYDNLCMLMYDDEELTECLFNCVGERLLRYYEIALAYDSVGAIIGNDDWGFKTQTMLSPESMRKYVFPWHKRIVEAAHRKNKPAILHSCGNLEAVMDDIIDCIQYDAKHSFEDVITPVEEVYDRYGSRIAIVGGIDMDFLCTKTPEEVAARCRSMLERASHKGGYALGTGNSVPEYVPAENYFAMINTCL